MASNWVIFHKAQWDVPNCYFMKRSKNLPFKFFVETFCTLEKLLNISWLKSSAHIVCYSSNSSRRCSSCPVKTFSSHSLYPSFRRSFLHLPNANHKNNRTRLLRINYDLYSLRECTWMISWLRRNWIMLEGVCECIRSWD